jgi:hypothetical protein
MRTDAQSDGQMERQTNQQTDIAKLAVAFRNFAKEGGIMILLQIGVWAVYFANTQLYVVQKWSLQ